MYLPRVFLTMADSSITMSVHTVGLVGRRWGMNKYLTVKLLTRSHEKHSATVAMCKAVIG